MGACVPVILGVWIPLGDDEGEGVIDCEGDGDCDGVLACVGLADWEGVAVGDALCVCEIVGEILDDLVIVSVGLCVWLLDCVELGDDVVVRDWDWLGDRVLDGEHTVLRPSSLIPP